MLQRLHCLDLQYQGVVIQFFFSGFCQRHAGGELLAAPSRRLVDGG